MCDRENSYLEEVGMEESVKVKDLRLREELLRDRIEENWC